MLDFTERKADCTGCTACLAACPVKCIQMEPDEEGFAYPIASDACIHCGKCERVCPIQNEVRAKEPTFPQKAFCGVTRSAEIWRRSASGGAFSEICRAFGDEETMICGAAWDGFSVRHMCVKGVDAIGKLCKSKYIASAPENTFSEIREYLLSEKKVIFCGTPCQVAGLKHFLQKPFDNLLLIDLICHGVGSPSVFQTCMDEIGRQFGKKLTAYEFRAKRKAYETDHLAKLSFSDRSEIYVTQDPYIQLFLKQLCLRPSCGKNCHFRRKNRPGDITIADFKGLCEVFPNLRGTKQNYSSIITNTPKGESVIGIMKQSMKMWECKLDDIKKYNPLFCRQTWFSEERDAFFLAYEASPSEAVRKYTTPASVNQESLKRKIYNLCPAPVRRLMTRIVRGNK